MNKNINIIDCLDEFFNQYVHTAFWSSSDNGDNFMDFDFEICDLSTDTKMKMKNDCRNFLIFLGNENIINICENSITDFAHDFWLTRNGHGAGFWDGDYKEPYAKQLTDYCRDVGICELYLGDDGKIHIC